MTVFADPFLILAFIVVLFGGFRLLLLGVALLGVPCALLYGLFRLIKWII